MFSYSSSQNAQSSLMPISRIQHFRLSSKPPTTTATLVKKFMYLCMIPFLSHVILLSTTMVVCFLFLAVKWPIKAPHTWAKESILPSRRYLYQVTTNPTRVVQKSYTSRPRRHASSTYSHLYDLHVHLDLRTRRSSRALSFL